MTTQIKLGNTILGTIIAGETATLDTIDKYVANNITATVITPYYDGTVILNNDN